MDQISESRLVDVLPLLAEKVRALSDQLQAEGVLIRVVQAVRTWEQQDALYDQGRSTPGRIVTNVKGGNSWHNFGCAVDAVPSTDEIIFQPDWNQTHPTWKRMVELAKSLGLDCGAEWRTFPDFPHFQLTGAFPENAPNDEVRELFAAGGLKAVWGEVMKAYSTE